jgi:hypothetical protein
VSADGVPLPPRQDLDQPGWTFTASNGVMRIRHDNATQIQITAFNPSAQVILLHNAVFGQTGLSFSWNSAPGAQYVVQGTTNPTSGWMDAHVGHNHCRRLHHLLDRGGPVPVSVLPGAGRLCSGGVTQPRPVHPNFDGHSMLMLETLPTHAPTG